MANIMYIENIVSINSNMKIMFFEYLNWAKISAALT